MRLTDLEPQWLHGERGDIIGFVFRSPLSEPGPRQWWQTCFFAQTSHRAQREALERAGFDDEYRSYVQRCNPDCAWGATGLFDFAKLSITPSLDGSAGGLWHGYITHGEIVGGLPE